MSDHEFEKKVQLKMEELKVAPSDAVWKKVEENIKRDKRRRRAILWLPFFFLLLGGGSILLFNGIHRSGQTMAGNQTNVSLNKNNTKAADNSTLPNSNISEAQTNTEEQSKVPVIVHQKEVKENNTPKIRTAIPDKDRNIAGVKKQKKQKAGLKNTVISSEVIVKKNERQEAGQDQHISEDLANNNTDANNLHDTTKQVVPDTDSALQKKIATSETTEQPVKKADKAARQHSSKWQFGLTAGAGMSTVVKGSLNNIFGGARVAD